MPNPEHKGSNHLLLILPPQLWLLEGFSSGLVSLASYVRRHLPEIDIRVLDLSHVSKDGLDEAIGGSLRGMSSAPVIGITTTTATYQSALDVARSCKRLAPGCKVVLGGHHIKSQEELILTRHRKAVDYAVSGEGEVSLVRLLQDYPIPARVPGLVYRDDAGRVARNSPAAMLDEWELDKIGFDFPGLELNSTPGKFGHVTYVSARGCPLQCSFCAVANERIRSKSIPCIVSDLRHIAGDLGYSSIAIEDNFFAQSPARTIALCEAISALQREEGIEFRWDCQTRVESMRRFDVLAAMARAKCEAAYLGVEALSGALLHYLNKTPHPQSYLEMLQESVVPQLLRSPMDCYINLQLGIPVETAAEWQETLTRLAGLGRTAEAHGKRIVVYPQLFVVYPGTKHYFEGVRHSLFPADVFESFTEWEHQNTPIRRFLGEEFAHGTGGIPMGLLEAEGLRHGGGYMIDVDAVLKIVGQLRDMDDVPGVEVFRYGRYLVRDECEAETKLSEMLRREDHIAA